MPTARFSRRVNPLAQPIKVGKNQLYEFKATRGDGRITLESLVGKSEIKAIIASKSIEFQATGDTGRGLDTEQSAVVEAMAREFNPKAPAKGPTFFLNMGDVIYGPGKQSAYSNKFYRPNSAWLNPAPGFKGIILGIPGNHDGEVRDQRDEPSLAAFEENFCQPAPTLAESFGVTMPNQPGVYWWLDAPFLDLIGLYSNAAEDFGLLGIDRKDTKQQDWLAQTLKTIGASRAKGERKALVIASHHPPYSQGLSESNSGHPGSPDMLAQIDAACAQAGIWPDMFISGHSHNYQRYMRTVTLKAGRKVTIPYLIAGTGGIGSQPAPGNIGNVDSTKTVVYSNGLGSVDKTHTVYGYLRVHASARVAQATFVQTLAESARDFETVAIDLATGEKTNPAWD